MALRVLNKLDTDRLVAFHKAKFAMQWADGHIRKDVVDSIQAPTSTASTQIESSQTNSYQVSAPSDFNQKNLGELLPLLSRF